MLILLFQYILASRDMTDTHTSVIKEKAGENMKVDEAEVESKNEEVSDEIQDMNGEVRSIIKIFTRD